LVPFLVVRVMFVGRAYLAELLNAVQAGRTADGAAAVHLVGQGGAVQHDIVRPNPAAESSQVAVGIERHARDRVHQGHDIPAIDRQLLDTRAFERVSEGSCIGGDHGGNVLHFHGDLGSRGKKCDWHRGGPLRLNLQGGFKLVHAGKVGRYFVWTGNDGGKHVQPRPVAYSFEFHSGRRIGQYHGDIWNDRARRVLNNPANTSITGLRPGGAYRQNGYDQGQAAGLQEKLRIQPRAHFETPFSKDSRIQSRNFMQKTSYKNPRGKTVTRKGGRKQ
jgi:hypothetical protein